MGYQQFMSVGTDKDLITTLKRVAAVLKQAGIPFALAGGFAAYARGGTSSDHDVDFLLREQDVDKALHALSEVGFRTVRPPEDWLVKVYDDDRMVDLIFRPVDRPVTDQTRPIAERPCQATTCAVTPSTAAGRSDESGSGTSRPAASPSVSWRLASVSTTPASPGVSRESAFRSR